MKRLVLAAALTALISVNALAGEIPTNDVVSPPPPPTSTQSATGNIPTNDVSASSTATQSSTSTELEVVLTNVLLTFYTLMGR